MIVKFVKQVLIILAFSLLGEALQALIPLPVPAAIYGLVLLLVALCAGLLKPEHIADTANFLIGCLPLLFVAPAVKLMVYWGIIRENWLPICAITVISTFVVFAVAGLVTKWLRKGGKSHD